MGGIWAKNGGIYVGYAAEWLEGPPPPVKPERLLAYSDDRHIVTFGPNGSGKSRRLLLPNLVRLTDWSMLVVDPKGDLAAMTAAYRQKQGSKIVILNPFRVHDWKSHGYNPIAALDPKSEDFPDDALGLAEAIIRVGGHEPHWGESAQELIAALIMYSRLTGENGGSFQHVRQLLGQSADDFGETAVKMGNAGTNFDCEELIIKSARFTEMDSENKELNSVISTALTQTRWLDSRPVKADLNGGAYDFSRMKREPTTVYLILPARRLATHSTWLRLMIASVLRSLIDDTRKPAVPSLLMLDEFAQLGHLPVIENMLALMRGYGVKLWAVFQDLSQAQAIYDKRWESFLSNAGVLQAFAPQDMTTAEYLSTRTGTTTRNALSYSQGSDIDSMMASSETLSAAPVSVPVMLPQELRSMDDGFSVLFTHRIKGVVRTYFPWPQTELPHMRDICALDPSE